MSSNESLTQSDEIPSEQAITIQPSGITAFPGAGEWMPAGVDASTQEGVGALAMLHAVRRHWLVILSTGLACATVTGVALYCLLKPKYEAVALLRLELAQPKILDKATADQGEQGGTEFEIFRDSQKSLITSPFVINAALRDPRLKNRACIVREDARHNAIRWLTEEIHAGFDLKNSSIMKVSATEPNADDAAAMVNAVVDAYMNEVVNADRQQRRNRLSELQKISGEKENEVRTKKEQLKRELEQNVSGGGDDQTVQIKNSMAMTLYIQLRAEYEAMLSQKRQLDGKLKELKAAQKDMENPEEFAIPMTEVVMLLNPNPVYRDLLSRHNFLEQMQRYQQQIVIPGVKPSPNTARNQAEYDATSAQLKRLEDDTKAQLREAKKIELDREVRHLTAQCDIADTQRISFEKEVEKKRIDVDELGKSTVSAQMQRADVENIERVLHGVADERERLRVELRSEPRVKPLGDENSPAAVPENETRDLRFLIIAFGSIMAMFVPAAGIVLLDLRKARINSVDDVSKRLKIRVIGSVPMIPPMVMRRLGDATRRSQIWKLRFTEAVDGVAARLLRKAECDQTRVILITSSLSGEGKTTLATQLAMSLARASRRTVLVDFDLRQPTLDGALGLPLGPGVCEALCGNGDIMDMVQQTETECLSVVTAGAWNRQVLPCLSNGSVGTVLEQLRANFDFVIIDSSPLLPIVDTRLVCQHVDAVLISVFRDVSQGSKVQASQEMLDAFGVRSIEAVVIGGEEHGSGKNQAYQATLLAEQLAPPDDDADRLGSGHAKDEANP